MSCPCWNVSPKGGNECTEEILTLPPYMSVRMLIGPDSSSGLSQASALECKVRRHVNSSDGETPCRRAIVEQRWPGKALRNNPELLLHRYRRRRPVSTISS